ncbi:protein N-terminal asparagine amidohydrolase [Trichonephila clavipes]|nr:protein N-terminal asparagine amidohydrolase [Trichonephila clavipes]
MPLIINGILLEELPPDTRTLFETYPHLKDVAAALIAQVPKVIGPVGLLYVHQREYAVTSPHDKHITVVGTEDTTTCNMTVLRHTGSGVSCVAHFDGSGLEQGVVNIVRHVQDLSMNVPEGRLELHLIGGFLDPRHYSEELALQLLYAFHKQPLSIHLVTACICVMSFLGKGKKADLIKLAIELGECESSGQELKIIELRTKILTNDAYKEDPEFVKCIFEGIVSNRTDEENKQKEQALCEFELQKIQLQNETQRVVGPQTLHQTKIEFKKLLPTFNPEVDNVDLFLTLFERQMKLLDFGEDLWVPYLRCPT